MIKHFEILKTNKNDYIKEGDIAVSFNYMSSNKKRKGMFHSSIIVKNQRPDGSYLFPENSETKFCHIDVPAKNSGCKVGVYPIDDDYWIDVGQWAEYKKALDKL